MLDFRRDGAALIARSISPEDVEALRAEFTKLGFRVGTRPFVISSLVRRLLSPDGCLGRAIASLEIGPARAVRVLAFDKTPANNWNLGWHQDRVIAVRERREVDGFGTWTLKNGAPHVEAPEDILRNMVFLRLHLDSCPAENGALKIIPGSADCGKLTDEQTKVIAKSREAVVCEAGEGDILAVRALTLHASEPSKVPSHRRVLHVDYCTCALPAGLEWALE